MRCGQAVGAVDGRSDASHVEPPRSISCWPAGPSCTTRHAGGERRGSRRSVTFMTRDDDEIRAESRSRPAEVTRRSAATRRPGCPTRRPRRWYLRNYKPVIRPPLWTALWITSGSRRHAGADSASLCTTRVDVHRHRACGGQRCEGLLTVAQPVLPSAADATAVVQRRPRRRASLALCGPAAV